MKAMVTFVLAVVVLVFGVSVAAAQAPLAGSGRVISTAELEEKASILVQINNVHQTRIGALSGMCFESATASCLRELMDAIAADRVVVRDGFEVVDQLESRLHDQQGEDARKSFENLARLREAFLDSQMNNQTYENTLNEKLFAQSEGTPALAGR